MPLAMSREQEWDMLSALEDTAANRTKNYKLQMYTCCENDEIESYVCLLPGTVGVVTSE